MTNPPAEMLESVLPNLRCSSGCLHASASLIRSGLINTAPELLMCISPNLRCGRRWIHACPQRRVHIAGISHITNSLVDLRSASYPGSGIAVAVINTVDCLVRRTLEDTGRVMSGVSIAGYDVVANLFVHLRGAGRPRSGITVAMIDAVADARLLTGTAMLTIITPLLLSI